jgi:hypothetical protein
VNSLNIKNVKSEDLTKKLKEKYVTISKEEKKKSALLSEIFPIIESTNAELREYSHSYFMNYFEENKKDFYALALLCDKESNFKKTFDEITNINRNEWSRYFSQDKKLVDKAFLKSIVDKYIKFTTYGTITFIDKISGSKSTLDFLKYLFDNETTASIVTDLFQPFEDNNNVINLESFFKSEQFKQKILNHEDILKMFLTYNSLKTNNK